MTDIQRRKIQLRSDLRQRRKAVSTNEQDTAAQALVNSVITLPNWTAARKVALYLAADGEISTCALVKLTRGLTKSIFLPRITDNDLGFAPWYKDAALSPNRYNIPEPMKDEVLCPASQLDIIFLPTVGWDRRGGRLGMGGGFYDRTLTDITGPLLVGLAYENQRVDDIPIERWDIPLDYVATDTALYHCRKLARC